MSSIRVIPIDIEGQKYFFYEMNDITELLRTKQDLNHKKGQLNTVLDRVHDGYWDWNIKEDHEYMSPRFWEMFGYQSEDKKNHPSEWQKIIFKDDLKLVQENFHKHIETKGTHPFKQEVRYKHKNGSTVWVICAGEVVEWDEEGKPLRMIGTHTDITKLKQATDSMSLNLRLAALGEMAGGLSHELNNPLAIINISADWFKRAIEKNKIDNSKFLTKIATIQKNIKRASSIIEGLKLYAGELNNEEKKDHDISNILSKTFSLLNDRMNKHQVKVVNNLEHKVFVHCDQTQIAHVFFNILSNAIDSLNGGHGTLITIDSYQSDKSVTLQFVDSATCQNRHRIVDLNAKVNTPDSQKNINLGLSVSRNIIESHGGTLESKELNSMNAFEVTLPLSNAPQQKEMHPTQSNLAS